LLKKNWCLPRKSRIRCCTHSKRRSNNSISGSSNGMFIALKAPSIKSRPRCCGLKSRNWTTRTGNYNSALISSTASAASCPQRTWKVKLRCWRRVSRFWTIGVVSCMTNLSNVSTASANCASRQNRITDSYMPSVRNSMA